MKPRPTLESMQQAAAQWLRQGISPRRLAFTLAVGFAVGCIPVVGVPTVLCTGLALALRLNLPAIQAANYAAMPLQLALILPFVRLGGWIYNANARAAAPAGSLLHQAPLAMLTQMSDLASHALTAWLLVAGPATLLLTLALTPLLRRVPVLAAAEADEGPSQRFQ